RSMCAWKLLESGQPAAGKSQSGQRNRNVAERVKVFGVMIKFSHTVFALPFALAAVILAQREAAITPLLVGLIIIAFIGARSAAMGFNRLVDAQIDARNPRTADRAIPTGLLTPNTTLLFVLVSCAVFIIAAGFISRLCLYLAVPVLFILFFYSYTKRFSAFSHLFLGFSIGLAPLGAWIAITGSFSWGIILLSVALMTYIAGFDILYACQDVESDWEQGLFSIPARMGIRPAMHISTLLHVLSFLFLLSLYLVFDMGPVYFIFVVIIGILFIIEHRLIAPDDISRIDVAFFHVNSVVSIVLFLGILLDEVVRTVF
ncbi:MAG: UbiA-like polyprenyltransferase, partial [Chloroflexota bacterium]|nr:UbiA-like polyprenyltransferase [Chloroflexota bacterium]